MFSKKKPPKKKSSQLRRSNEKKAKKKDTNATVDSGPPEDPEAQINPVDDQEEDQNEEKDEAQVDETGNENQVVTEQALMDDNHGGNEAENNDNQADNVIFDAKLEQPIELFDLKVKEKNSSRRSSKKQSPMQLPLSDKLSPDPGAEQQHQIEDNVPPTDRKLVDDIEVPAPAIDQQIKDKTGGTDGDAKLGNGNGNGHVRIGTPVVESPTPTRSQKEDKDQSFCMKHKRPLAILFLLIIFGITFCVAMYIVIVRHVDADIKSAKASQSNVPVKEVKKDPTECSDGLYYIKETKKCGPCKTDASSGYIKASQSCATCQPAELHSKESQSCVPCPCGADCNANFVFYNDNACFYCPNWQTNKGDNKCVDRCQQGERWDGQVCQKKENYLNGCQYSTGYNIFYGGSPKDQFFDDLCSQQCHKLELQMHLDAPKWDIPYFPRQISCKGDRDGVKHGTATEDTELVEVGATDACIYRIERQGSSPLNITAVRYSWIENDAIQTKTFGEYKYGQTTAFESFNGCLFGFHGSKQSGEGKFMDISFQYKYPALF